MTCAFLAAVLTAATTFHSASLSLAAQTTLAPDPQWWLRHVAIVRVAIAGKQHAAILDTGGYTELRALAPRDFQGYYRGLPIDAALGANSIAKVPILIGGRRAGKVSTLRVQLQRFKHEIYAFTSVRLGGDNVTMLFDTGALGWPIEDAARSHPYGINFLRSVEFRKLHRLHPRWPFNDRSITVLNEKGASVEAASLTIPHIGIGPFTSGPATFVERGDDTTYQALWKMGHIVVNGDLGLAALNPKWLELDYPRSKIIFGL